MIPTSGILGADSAAASSILEEIAVVPVEPVSEDIRQERIDETRARAFALIERRVSTVRWNLQQFGDGHLINHGTDDVPDFARLVAVGGREVFRHYARTQAKQEEILNNGEITAGPLPFAERGGGAPYRTLVGAFLTTPPFMPEQVGVPDSVWWVDVALYEGTGLLHLGRERDWCYLIPGIPKPRRDDVSAYRIWLEEGSPDEKRCHELAREKNYQLPWNAMFLMVDHFQKLKSEGGFKEPSRIPVKIIASGEIS